MAALLALLAAVGWGSSDYAAGHASRRSSAISVVVLTHLTAVVVLLAVAVDLGPVWTMVVELIGDPAAEPQVATPRIAGRPTWVDMAWGLAAGLGGGFGAMLLFRGLGRGRMAVVAPVTAAGAAVIPVAYGLATGESLTPYGLAGIGLALVAIVLVSLADDDGTGTDLDEIGQPVRGAHDPGLTPPGPVSSDNGVLTVPEGWLEAYGRHPLGVGPAAGSGGAARPAVLPSPNAANRVAAGPVPTPLHGPVLGVGEWSASARAAVMLAERVEEPTLSAPAAVASSPDVGATVRAVLRVMLTLMLALIVGALGVATISVVTMIDSGRVEIAPAAIVGVSLLTAAIATTALHVARPLFRFGAAVAPSGALESRPEASRWRRTLAQPGLVEALLSGVGFGAFFVCIYRASEAAGQWPLIGARGISVVMFAIGALVTRTAVVPARGGRLGVVVAGLLDAAAAVLFVLATRAGLLSIGAVLASLYPAVTVLLARTVGKEPVGRRQLAGLVLALGAIGLLAI